MKANIYVTRPIPQAGLDLLKQEFGGYEMNTQDRVLSRKELLSKIKGRDAVLCLLTDKIDPEAMDIAGPNIKIFSNMAVGFDNINIPEATKRKILVGNTPGVLTLTTAEMAWSLLFATARRIPESDKFNRAGKFKAWGPLMFLGLDVTGRTLGVVGAGRIGAAFAMMSKGFKMNVLYHDQFRNETLEKELGAKKVELDTLLRESDFVSLHVNLTSETRHMISTKQLEMMKPTAILVNTSRGPVIDEKALTAALKKGTIFGAGMDVYEEEPKMAPGLSKLPNAVLAPHLASATIETRNKMATLAAENLISALKGERPRHLVNPEAFQP